MNPPIRRLSPRFKRDASRTITRFFWTGPERGRRIVGRLGQLDEERAASLLAACLRDFGGRYVDLPGVLEEHFDRVRQEIDLEPEPDPMRRRLIGAYFTMEYAYASAALFNPSMVPAVDQTGVAPGCVRFVMSLRAVGEGHISSIVFRRGTLDERGDIAFDPVPERSRRLRVVENRSFEKSAFLQKLIEAGAYAEPTGDVLDRLDDTFTHSHLTAAIERARRDAERPSRLDATADMMQWLARSNYQVQGPPDADLSEMVLFPLSEAESNGLEDMRLVRFVDDDGTPRYYGTYTAYNGARILPQIMEMGEAGGAEVHTLAGRHATDKGMALFPRRLDGWYAMISRIDGENLYVMRSDNVRFWNEAVRLEGPRQPWEFVQVGNCGSPIETDAGWLLLTHGVGPMRRYCIGAMLLDIEDPTTVIGQLAEPLLVPLAEESRGYVPNVVYSCGGMVHNGILVIPYGISDVETGFATVGLDDLLGVLGG